MTYCFEVMSQMKRIHNLLFRMQIFKNTKGQDLIEYALLAALIALAATVGMTALAGGINEKFTAISSSLAS